MKNNFLSVLFAVVCLVILPAKGKSQQVNKPSINYKTYQHLPQLGFVRLSGDGLYVMYMIDNLPAGKNTLVIKALRDDWQKSFIGASFGEFDRDSRVATFQMEDGKFASVDLNTKLERYTEGQNQSTVIDKEINREEEDSNQIDSIKGLASYMVSRKNKGIAIATHNPYAPNRYYIYWHDVAGGTRSLLDSVEASGISFNTRSDSGVIYFTASYVIQSDSTHAGLEIWTYNDINDPSPFNKNIKHVQYEYAINGTNNQIIQLTYDDERIESVKGTNALVCRNAAMGGAEAKWNARSQNQYYLVSLTDGTRKVLPNEKTFGYNYHAHYSPDGAYIIFISQSQLRYYSYNTRTEKLIEITKGHTILNTHGDFDIRYMPSDFVWKSNTQFIINDEFDLWQFDITGDKKPLCLTAEYGRRNKISFRFANVPKRASAEFNERRVLGFYLLRAIDHKTKDQGFYKMPQLDCSEPVKLDMGPYYYGPDTEGIHAADDSGQVFVVKRSHKGKAPNFFITSDFKHFLPLTDLYPERQYNWLTSELLGWKLNDGRNCNGILFKPENFDSTKKYPVMVMVYNEYSGKLNEYVMHGSDWGVGMGIYLPIPWLASNGYLVFVPDIINRKPGEHLKGALDGVLRGLKIIKSLPYVDSRKIGLQGCSWGSAHVNYFVTHTNSFAAAFSSAGFVEQITNAYSDPNMNRNYINTAEEQIGGLLTEVPDLYIKNSPLFSADRMNTPLLLQYNIADGAVPFHQGLQFFRLLRRLGKKVWMLSYQKGGHGVEPGPDQDDLYIRMTQFFEHYLKDKPVANWMLQGVRLNNVVDFTCNPC